MKRFLTGAAAVGLGVTTVVLGFGSARPAGAATGLETAYWWVGQQQAGLAPAPPSQVVPDGGLWASSNPSGPQAISAVRFTLSDTESAPILTLKVASEKPEGTASVAACPISSPWAPVVAGDWNTKPTYDCATVALASRSIVDGANLVAFDLSSLVVGKVANVAIVPVPGPAQLPGQVPGLPASPPSTYSAFDITFEKPSEASIAVFTLPDETDDEADLADVVPPPAFLPPDDSFAFTPTDFGVIPSTVPTPTTAGTPELFIRPTTQLPVAVAKSDKRSAARVAAALVFLALAAWWYQITFAGGERRAGTSTRPRLSLYDDPRRVLAGATSVRPARVGHPPALR